MLRVNFTLAVQNNSQKTKKIIGAKFELNILANFGKNVTLDITKKLGYFWGTKPEYTVFLDLLRQFG